jgi:stearoyl-CoA desaturase (Delta-9 desaturase)
MDAWSLWSRPVSLVVAVLAGLAVTQLATFATTVYLHRGLAHRALSVGSPAAPLFRFIIWITTGMRPREWVAVHRRHHANTDTADDPHSPAIVGFWRVQLANAALYRRVARDRVSVSRYARDLPSDRYDRLFFDHALVGLAIGIAILCVTLGWRTGLVAAAIHAVSYLMLSGAINAVGHTRGRRPHDNSGTNGQLLALLTAGEGLHNNHHAAPTSARFALGRREVDPGWWLVRVLVRCRVATVRHDEVKLKQTA